MIINYYNLIKGELINNEIAKNAKNYSINRSDLNTCYNVYKTNLLLLTFKQMFDIFYIG